MTEIEPKNPSPRWWATSSLRIIHAKLDPDTISKLLNAQPKLTALPGESKLYHGNSKSAGYWMVESRIEDPLLPDKVIQWIEDFARQREGILRQLISQDYSISCYLTVHTKAISLGFNLPAIPILTELRIPVGLEIFA